MSLENSILLVEDDPRLLFGTTRLFNMAGYLVTPAGTGEEALILAKEKKPDLILLDIELPGMDGIEVCQKLKSDSETSSIFISILSGKRVEPNDLESALNIGADEYITRPIKNDTLLARVKAIFRIINAEKKLLEQQNNLEQLIQQRTEELLHSEQRLKLALDASNQAIWDWYPGKDFLFFDDNWFEMLGYERGELTQEYDTWLDLLHHDDKDQAERTIKSHLENKDPFQIEFRARTKDGGWKWILGKGKVVESSDANKPIRVVGTHTDITERKKADLALKESEKIRSEVESSLRLSLEAADAGTWTWNVLTGEVIWDDQMQRIFGFNPGEFDGSFIGWKERVHPDDVDLAEKKTLEALNSTSSYSHEYRVKGGNGNWRIINAKAATLTDSNGRPVRMSGFATDVTDQKKSEQLLVENKAFLESIFKVAPTGIGVTIDRVFKEVNETFCKMIGYSKNELIGQPSSILYPTIEEYKKVGEVKYKQIKQQGTGSVETKLLRKNGEIIDVLLTSTPINPSNLEEGVTFTTLDITENKKVENALLQSEGKYRSIMESMEEAVYICSSDFKIEYMNPKMIEEIGRDATGETCHEAIYQKNDKCSWCSHGEVMKGKVIKNEIAREISGKQFLISSTPISNNKGDVSKLTIYRDITHQREMEYKIQQAQRLESIGTLAAGIAHDFNNLLTPIIGITEMMLEDFAPNEMHYKSARAINKAGERAASLVKQILAFSRQSDEKVIPLGVQQIAKEVVKLCRSSMPASITIEQYIQDDCSLVMATPSQVHQVIMNLLTNALHAVEETKGKISIQVKQRELSATETADNRLSEGSYVEIQCIDNGHGIAPEILDKLFDPYFTTKEKDKGTGLGLATVYGIVQDLQGEIFVDTKINQGTNFRVVLPTTQDIKLKRSELQKDNLAYGNEQLLLVDDEKLILEMMQESLERLGYKVTTCSNGFDALHLFRENPSLYDLVISDVAMPLMTGDQLAKELLQIKPSLPIILCTGFSDRISKEKAIAMGVKDFLMKPIVKSKLAEVLRNILDAESY